MKHTDTPPNALETARSDGELSTRHNTPIAPQNGAQSFSATLLALDASSTTIGWVVFDGAVRDHGTIYLKHSDVNHRCRLARAHIAGLIAQHPYVDAVAIEGPASPHKGALIPQCFVSGAIRSYVAELDIAICDVPPQHAKQALAGRGNASKADMMEAAAAYGVEGEHASDALGVALHASKMATVEYAKQAA